MRENAGVLLDPENLFARQNFAADGEYAKTHDGLIDEDSVRQELAEEGYPLYLKTVAKHPELAVVPRYVDLLLDWLAARYAVALRRTFGNPYNPAVRASRERLKAHDWGFTPVGSEPGAADKKLLSVLYEAARVGRFEVYVVGSSDARDETGILVRASEQVTMARRLRPGSKLVVVEGPESISTTKPGRWSDADDLGQIDEVYPLSRIVDAQLRTLRTDPSRTPRTELTRPPSSTSATRQRWRRTVDAWVTMDDEEIKDDLTRRLRGLDEYGIARAFTNFERALRSVQPDQQRRLRLTVALLVNELIVSAGDAETAGRIASTPRVHTPRRRDT